MLLEREARQVVHKRHRLHADAQDAAHEVDDVLLVLAPGVGVANDAAAFVDLDAVLVDDPLQRRARAEAVAEVSTI